MQSRHDSKSLSVAPASSSTPTRAFDTDALSEVLQSIRLTGSLFFLVDSTSPWGATAPSGAELAAVLLPKAQQLVSYHLVKSGSCWCEVAGGPPVRLETGDVAVIPHGDVYSLGSEPGRRGEVPVSWYRDAACGNLPGIVVQGGGGPDRSLIICGFLGCDLLPFNPLLGTLPPLLHVQRATDEMGIRLRQLIELAADEFAQQSPGGHCVLLRIGELIFVEVVRRHLASLPSHENGWLVALRDPALGRVLALLHQHPCAPWTLDALARKTGMSRSSLVERFKEKIGQPPMQYLARWRIQLAARKLADSTAKVVSVARNIGYESEAAFSRAFKRTVGMSPAEWRERQSAGRSVTPD